MGELASKHISGTKTGSKEYIRTTELFFDKVFGDKKKFSHDFATKKVYLLLVELNQPMKMVKLKSLNRYQKKQPILKTPH